jgi:hypothetical protein
MNNHKAGNRSGARVHILTYTSLSREAGSKREGHAKSWGLIVHLALTCEIGIVRLGEL